jgi:hypothetical protein
MCHFESVSLDSILPPKKGSLREIQAMCLDAEPLQFLDRAIFSEHGTWNVSIQTSSHAG